MTTHEDTTDRRRRHARLLAVVLLPTILTLVLATPGLVS